MQYWKLGIAGPRGPAFLFVSAKSADAARQKILMGDYLEQGEQIVTVHSSSEMDAMMAFSETWRGE